MILDSSTNNCLTSTVEPGTPARAPLSRWLVPLTTMITATLLGTTACAPISQPVGEPRLPTATEWVDSTLAQLTLRQRVGQLVAPWLAGDYLATDSDAYDRIQRWVVDEGIGGLVISIGPPLEIAAKLNLIQELAEVPLLITADMEHGPGQRLDGGIIMPNMMLNGGGTSFPPMMAYGATADPNLAYQLGRITAAEAKAVGIGMILAPVVDLNNNPANPVINTRSYGEDPELVAKMATAHIQGIQGGGLYAVAKHFPGHGDTGTDSHIDLPRITVDRARADSMELRPFRAAIEAGVTGVMSAHITFPALTGDSTPATLSREILTGLLVDELGFQGLIVSDALDMGAIVRRYGPGEAMVRAIEAGVDLILMPANLTEAIDAVVDAVETGRLSHERIERSVRRILELKAGLQLHEERTIALDRVQEVVGSRAHNAVAAEVARRAITLPRDEGGLIPLDPEAVRDLEILSITYTGDRDPIAGRAFNQTLRQRLSTLRTREIDPKTSTTELDSILAAAEDADIILFSAYQRVVTGSGTVSIPEPIAQLVTDLALARPTIVISFGNPYLLQQFPEVGTYLLAWGPAAVTQRAAADAIIGESPITGTLPIPIPPLHRAGTGIVRGHTPRPIADPAEVGMDPSALALVDQIIDDAIFAGSIPGAALAVGRHGELVRLRGYGHLDPRPGYDGVTDSTIYDLASLTKVVGTTTAVMILTEEGHLDLDAPVTRYIPEWQGDPVRNQVTVRQLLTHTAGLPPFAPLWREHRGREAFLQEIAQTELQYEPGTKELYSDFGMILLGIMIERIAGQPLDHLLDERVFTPLGLRETGFNPLSWHLDPVSGSYARKSAPQGEAPVAAVAAEPSTLARIAPTEYDTVFRMTHIHGEVHDENAYAIGGVAGHAGLFSSARDLAVFAQMLLDGGHYTDPHTGEVHRLLESEMIDSFTTRLPGGTSRALGWDTPAGRSSAGDYFTARSFGHTGFTGTSIWIDPERDLFVVLLTNRVNPTRANQSHIALRRAVHDAVQKAIIDQPVTRR